MDGWIKLHRKLKEHWIWKSDNRLKWWIDILLTVNHTTTKVLIKGSLIECNRGQSVRSLESWAKDWNVSKKTVRDFFKLLEKDNMLSYENIKVSTRITILNYDTYNDVVNTKETQSKRKVNAKETQSKRNLPTNKNDKERIKNDKEYININELNFIYDTLKPFFNSVYEKQRNAIIETYDKLIRIDKFKAQEIIDISIFIREGKSWYNSENFQSPVKLRKTNSDGIKYVDYFKGIMQSSKTKTQPQIKKHLW